jgi:mRNA interferase MazF
VLILTRDSAIPFLTALTIAPITSTIRAIPTEVVLSEDDGMPGECAATLDNLQTVPKAQIGSFITHLAPERMREVRDAIVFALDLDSLAEGFGV